MLPSKEAKSLAQEVIKELSTMQMDSCVIGGVAVSLLAYPRATKDIDICVYIEKGYLTEEEIKKLEKKLDKNWKLDRSSPQNALTFTLKGNEKNELEIFVNTVQDARGSPELDNDFWRRVQVVEDIPTCSREDLIALKSFITDVTPQDRRDIMMLLRTGEINKDYLYERLQRWGCINKYRERAPMEYRLLLIEETEKGTTSRDLWIEDYKRTYERFGKIPRGYFKKKGKQYGVHPSVLYNYLVRKNIHKPKRRRHT